MQRRQLLQASAAALLAAGCDAPRSPIQGGFNGTNPERGHLVRDSMQSAALLAQPAVQRRTGVLIAGGGVAGLAAARALRLRGVEDFALLELEDEAGGNSRAGRTGGLACPLGAHYLPVPGDDARDVQDLLEEMGLRQRVAGRWGYDERYLCHSPQERLLFQGEWQEGLLPVQDVGDSTLAQYRKFAQRIETLAHRSQFVIPVSKSSFAGDLPALDAITFEVWLNQQELTDPHLRWYLDYCCRDDYGAGLATVSAWAGIHYFASRHGFHAPGTESGEREGVLTWPEGNGWLTRRMAASLGERLHTGRTVLRIADTRSGVQVDAFDHATQQLERWQAAQCIVALPVFIAARLVQNPPDFLGAAAAKLRYSPWLVANIHIREPLADRAGAPPSWDNVIYGDATGGLGYVDAGHQRLDPRPGPTVLSYYRALGDQPDGRAQLLQRPWSHWRDDTLTALAGAHPDLPEKATRIDIARYGHAMAIPVPGTRRFMHEISSTPASKLRSVLSISERSSLQMGPQAGRLRFAHSDWSGYSVFEEAFTRGNAAGQA